MPPPRKRTLHEVIDLPSDDDGPRAAKAPRTAIASGRAQSSSQSSQPSHTGQKHIGPSSIYAGLSQLAASIGSAPGVAYQQPRAPQQSQNPFDDDDPELLDLTQGDDAPLREFYGSIDNKIVGCRYYRGIVTLGELVVLRREPNNEYVSALLVSCSFEALAYPNIL